MPRQIRRLAARWIAGAFSASLALMAVGATPGTVTYQYDAAGRLIAVINTNDSTTAYTLDAAGNRKQVAVTADTTTPPAPTGLGGTAVSSTQVNLTWTASADGQYTIGGYYIYRGGSQIGSSTTTSYSDTTTACKTTYSYTVAAYDTVTPTPHVSAQSTAWPVTTPITIPPSVPTGLTKTSATASQVVIGWTASTGSCGASVAGYRVYRGGTQIGTSTSLSYTDSTVAGSTTYSYTVASYDNQSTPNVSAQSSPLSVTTPGAGTFLFVSGTHTAAGSSNDIATATIKNSGTSTITAISWTCPAGSFHTYGSGATSIAAGASTTYQCQAAASGSYTATIVLTGTGATNSPYSASW
jgi:YD repeat-containing protein